MKNRGGYAFPMALASIAIIALIATSAHQRVSSAVPSISELQNQLDAYADAQSSEQTLIYHMLTSPMGALGVQVGGNVGIARILSSENPQRDFTLIPANGTPFQHQNIVTRYYDQQGFFNIATSQTEQITNLLRALDVPTDQWSTLIATLQDFQDSDDRRRPSGGESSSYRQNNLPPNRPLRSPLELCQVIGWRELRICSDEGQLLLITDTRPQNNLNIRFASHALLDLLVAGEGALELIRSNNTEGELQSFSRIGHTYLDNVDDLTALPTAPTSNFVVVSHNRAADFAWKTSFELTPESVIAPFSVKHRYRIEGAFARQILAVGQDENLPPLP